MKKIGKISMILTMLLGVGAVSACEKEEVVIESGVKWHSGSGVPTVIEDVNNGDFYFDLTNNDI